MSITIPIPANFLTWLWFAMGINFGRSFGKKMDLTIQNSNWYKKRKPWQQWLVARSLDCLHHWWMGGLLMIYFVQPEIYWFGVGLLVDDLPDIPRRAKELLAEWKKYEEP